MLSDGSVTWSYVSGRNHPQKLVMGRHLVNPSIFKLLQPANEVWGKVIFSQACVKNSVYRGNSVHWLFGGRKLNVFTVRKRSFGQGNVFTHVSHSVHGASASRGDLPTSGGGELGRSPRTRKAGGLASY